jgi:hypothetical protein
LGVTPRNIKYFCAYSTWDKVYKEDNVPEDQHFNLYNVSFGEYGGRIFLLVLMIFPLQTLHLGENIYLHHLKIKTLTSK